MCIFTIIALARYFLLMSQMKKRRRLLRNILQKKDFEWFLMMRARILCWSRKISWARDSSSSVAVPNEERNGVRLARNCE